MFLKSKVFQISIALCVGIVIMLIPRPEGTQFQVIGDDAQKFYTHVSENFNLIPLQNKNSNGYIIEIKDPTKLESKVKYLRNEASNIGMSDLKIDYVDGLSLHGMKFLALLAVLVVLFMLEPMPLEIIAIFIGVSLVLTGITDVKTAWAPYMHPVVVFVMCCLIFALALDKSGITKRLAYFIIKKAGTNVVKFTFILAGSLGIASSFLHDAAACAIGIVTILPLMKAAGINAGSRTGNFMMLSIPFACSCGGMGTLIGGGRCMVAAAFLKEFTGIEITFFEWFKYAMPMAIVTVPVAILVVYFVFRPDQKIKLPEFDLEIGKMTSAELKTLIIIGLTFTLWLTKGLHGIHYSVTGMIGVAFLIFTNIIEWEDIHKNLEWGTALFIFGGGISLGLAMGYSGAAKYLSALFFPLVQGGGWILLFIGVGVFGALITNAMANVAAAALILPIIIPLAQLEGVNPVVMALCLGMSTSFAMLLVIGCPPNAIAYSYRYFKASDLTKAGAVATPVLLLVIFLMASVWWKIIGLV